MSNPFLQEESKNPFLEYIEKQKLANKPNPLLSPKQQKEKDEERKSGNPTATKLKRFNNQAQKARGGKSQAQIAKELPGSFVYSVNDARGSMGIKAGSEDDANLKAVMYRFASDGKIDANEMVQIQKMGRAGLAQKASQYRDENARANNAHNKLKFTEDAFKEAVSRGDESVKTKEGGDIPLKEAYAVYGRAGLKLGAVQEETEEAQQIRHAMSGGVVPVEGQNFANRERFDQKRSEARESSVNSIMAGAKSPFAQLLETVSPAAKEGRLRALEIGREEGKTGKQLLEDNKIIGAVAGDVGTLPIAVLGSGLGTKAVDIAIDAITAIPELFQAYGALQSGSADKRGQGLAQAALTIILGTPTGREVLGSGLQKLGEVSGLMKQSGRTFEDVLDDLDLTDRLDVKEAKDALEEAFKDPKIKQFADEYKSQVGVEFRDPNAVGVEYRDARKQSGNGTNVGLPRAIFKGTGGGDSPNLWRGLGEGTDDSIQGFEGKSSPDVKRRSINTYKLNNGNELHEIDRNYASEFKDAIERGKASQGAIGASVHVYEPDEYAKMRLYLTDDSLGGFAIKDGDIVSVFRNKEGKRGFASSALKSAVENGGNRLDAFATELPAIYAKSGFKPTSKIPWNDEHAPMGWDYGAMSDFNGGRPDVVFFAYDPAFKYDPETFPKVLADIPYARDYDDAVRIQMEVVNRAASPSNVTPKVNVPKELTGKVDETFLGKKASEWETRLAELQSKSKPPQRRDRGGIDPDVLEEAILRAGIAVARAGEPIEKAIRSAMSQMGLSDDAFNDIRGGLNKELGLDDVPSVAPKQVETTGLANQVQARETSSGALGKVESAGGKSAEDWQKIGAEKVSAGADYDELSAKVGRGDTEFTAERAGILLEGKRIKLAKINKLIKNLEDTPNDPKLLAELRDAQDELQTYVENVQKAKGRWSDVGRSLQAGSTVDEGNFADVVQRMEQSGKKVDPKVKLEVKNLTDQVAAKDKQIAELEESLNNARAEQIVRATPRTKNTDVARARVQKSKQTIKELWDSGKFFANDGVAMSTILPTPPRLTQEAVDAIKDLAKSSVELGVKTLGEVVSNIKTTLKDNGIELDDQAIIDALATTNTVERSELAEQMAKLKARAKKLSTEAKNNRTYKQLDKSSDRLSRENDKYVTQLQDVNKQIAETKRKLDTGEYIGGKKDPAGAVNTRLGTLRAERDVYASKLRRAMAQHDKSKTMKVVGAVTQNIRGLKLGADIGILLRQGAAGLTHPKKYGKAIMDGLFSAKSEANQMMLNRNIRDARYSDGRLAEYTRNKAGLSLTVDMNTQEELVVGRILQKLPGVGKFSGSLERFQSGFINSLRAQLFDSVAEKKLSLDELKSRARYINAVTGRGNVGKVHELLSVAMTSPRYEVSRWQTILEGFRSPIEALKGNKGAVENVKDMGKMVGGVFALYKMAELAGYETQFDPTHTDFLKLRKGNDVWDISAGLAPRMRDIARLMATVVAPDFFNNGMSVAMKGGGRTISPGVSIPSQYGSAGAQMTLGKTSDAKKSADQIKNFISGFEDEETKKGLMALMPLWLSSAMEAYGDEKNTGDALWTFTREWLGTGVSRYEKNSKDSQLMQLIKDAERRAKSRTEKKQ